MRVKNLAKLFLGAAAAVGVGRGIAKAVRCARSAATPPSGNSGGDGPFDGHGNDGEASAAAETTTDEGSTNDHSGLREVVDYDSPVEPKPATTA